MELGIRSYPHRALSIVSSSTAIDSGIIFEYKNNATSVKSDDTEHDLKPSVYVRKVQRRHLAAEFKIKIPILGCIGCIKINNLFYLGVIINHINVFIHLYLCAIY